MFEQILFPIDSSRETSHAIELVTNLAQQYKSQVTILSVLDDSQVAANELEQARQTINNFLTQTESALNQVGLTRVKTAYQEGKVPFVICDVADELGVDLIVMGSRGVVNENQDDSVSNRVINLAPCPVLVVP